MRHPTVLPPRLARVTLNAASRTAMSAHRHTATRHLAALPLLVLLFSVGAAASPNREKSTWNYDGGVFLETDGSLPGEHCFRIQGRVTSGHFFDDLKRIDEKGLNTIFRRGKEVVTEFPEQLLLEFSLFDMPCPAQYRQAGTRTYLTRAQVSALNLSLYWKRGLELRPLSGFKPVGFSVRQLFPFNTEVQDLPDKFEWNYALSVPSNGVPLTDSLVLIIRAPDGQIAARVAARL
jgi:hypothetical protein